MHAPLLRLAGRQLLWVRSGLLTKLNADRRGEGLHLDCLRTAVLGARKHCTPLINVHCIAETCLRSGQRIARLQSS